jgi:hypothetical protein
MAMARVSRRWLRWRWSLSNARCLHTAHSQADTLSDGRARRRGANTKQASPPP